jgi:hypothetical protein
LEHPIVLLAANPGMNFSKGLYSFTEISDSASPFEIFVEISTNAEFMRAFNEKKFY